MLRTLGWGRRSAMKKYIVQRCCVERNESREFLVLDALHLDVNAASHF